VAREVDLYEKHLTIMSCRTGMQFDLVIDGVDQRAFLPPAIFHTLIENAISHNGYREGRIAFHLAETNNGP
jgi:LytS/YehU family sensor histidine kinase